MIRFKLILKTVLLAPISALILVSLIFTFYNYPDLKSVTLKNSDLQISTLLQNNEFKNYIDNSIANNSTSQNRSIENKNYIDNSIANSTSQNRNYVDSSIAEVISQNSFGQLTRKQADEILASTLRIVSVAKIDSTISTSIGTGVIINSEKIVAQKFTVYKTYIITNKHVVGNVSVVKVEAFNYLEAKFVSGITSYSGSVVLSNDDLDLALIRVVSPQELGHASHLITPSEFDNVYLYQAVYVCGCSLGEPPSITNGNLSNVLFTRFLVSAWATFGNSGGGAFTVNGEILGIVNLMGSIRTPDGKIFPEPNRTSLIPSPVICVWLKENKINF